VDGLDRAQRAAVALLAGYGPVAVLQGAAGAGKTATLAATRGVLAASGRGMVVVTPTRKAAQVARRQVGAGAHSVGWLLHQHGYRWDNDGHWRRVASDPVPAARLARGDTLVVDEAGMLDQDAARAVFELADHTGARVVLVGDRHQLPAVGRGGVLDLATRYAPGWCLSVEGIHRFTDPTYAELSLRMRRGADPGAVFDELVARGDVVLHPTEVERTHALAAKASLPDPPLVVADTREQVAAINGLVHQVRLATGEATDGVVTGAGERIGVGDRICTRRNDADLGVANRETWTVTGCDSDGELSVTGVSGSRRLPASYARTCVELAYATTVYGAQGETVEDCHVLVGEHSGASSAYVGMTRGRQRNVAHLVAASPDEARRQWIGVFSRDRADLGPAHAALRAADDIERYGPTARPQRRRPKPAAERRREDDFTCRPSAASPGPSIGL
jgi:exodeoxyribonuclease V alpha subunit